MKTPRGQLSANNLNDCTPVMLGESIIKNEEGCCSYLN